MHVRGGRFCVIVAPLVAALTVVPAVVFAQEVTPVVTVTDDGTLARGHEAASVVVDVNDPETVYLANVEMFSNTCQFHVSRDAGATWTALDPPVYDGWSDCGLGSAGPKNIRTELKQPPDGTLYYVFHGNELGGSRSALLGQSQDGGASWQVTAIHEAPIARTLADVELNFLTHIAIDPDDPQYLVATWRRSYPRLPDTDPRPTRPWMATSTDGGATWSEASMMFDDDIGFDGPRPVIVDGTIYAIHRVRPGPDAPEGALNHVAVSSSADGGETWERAVIVEADDVSEGVLLYDEGRGRFYAVWHDNTNGNLDAFFASSSDGVEWSAPVRLNDDPPEATTGQFYPQMALAPNGRIDVAWYDYRDDTYPAPVPEEGAALNLFNNMGKQQAVYATSSTDEGATWSPNRRINDVRIDRSTGLWDPDSYFFQVPLAIASTNDGPVIAWSDTRNGDVLTATQDIVTANLAATDRPGASWSWLLLGGLAGTTLGAGAAAWGMLAIVRRRTGGLQAPAAPEPVDT